jgi:maltose-binding protein MalE
VQFLISEVSENKELAWEFVKFLTTERANEDVFYSGISINKSVFKKFSFETAKSTLHSLIVDYGFNIDIEADEVAMQVVSKLETYNNMPVVSSEYVEVEMIYEIIKSFCDGIMTAEQAAASLQNKISLYLME